MLTFNFDERRNWISIAESVKLPDLPEQKSGEKLGI